MHELFPYTAGSDLGYNLGLTGGLLMLALLLYPVRKHVKWLHRLGPLKYWFRAHMIGGILGPTFILMHSTFRIGSLNALVALTSMLLVASSGLVGRFVYRRIHHGLYGSRANMKDLSADLTRRFEELAPAMARMHVAEERIDAFARLAGSRFPTWRGRAVHFMTLGWKRAGVARHTAGAAERDQLKQLAAALDATLRAIQQTAQFTTYERLFALWHVAHIPFLYMLAFTAAFHVLAVHMY
jgi:hypothetical protein